MNWKFWKVNKVDDRFPCSSDKCLVRVSCTKACDKIITDNDKLKEAFMKYKCCPDCGSVEFYDGPCGGLCQNIKCAGCGHWFNVALPMICERIHFAGGRFYD